MTQPAPQAKPGAGPAAGIRWDLSDLYAVPRDTPLEADLERSLEAARAFERSYRGKVATLPAEGLAQAVDALERLNEPLSRALSYAGLLFAADTGDPQHGALLQRVQ